MEVKVTEGRVIVIQPFYVVDCYFDFEIYDL